MTLELLSQGHRLLEAPLYDATLGLVYTDALAGGLWRHRQGAEPELVIAHRRGIGGVARHAEGGYVVSGRNVAHKPSTGDVEPDRPTVYLASDPALGRTGYNDLVTDNAGRVYVGSLAYVPMLGQQGSDRTGQLLVIGLSGEASVVAQGIELSNGLGFSPTGTRLYHADSGAGTIFRYEVRADGSLSDRAVFARARNGMPDGLAVAEDGSVWVAMVHAGEVVRFDPDGGVMQRIAIPVPMVTSLCFGGDDWQDLFIVSGAEGAPAGVGGCIFRLRASVAGRARPLARTALVATETGAD